MTRLCTADQTDLADQRVIAVVVGSLSIDPSRRLDLSSALTRLFVQHRLMAHILRNPLTGKERKLSLQRLIKSLSDARELFGDLLLGTKFALNEALTSGPGPAGSLISFERDLGTILETLHLVQLNKKSPGPRNNAHLNHLVGALTLLLQAFTGKRPVAYYADGPAGKEPTFKSKEASAIRDLARHLEPGTSNVTILNQILKIRKDYTDERLRATFECSITSWRVTGYTAVPNPK